jgi:hypothetical protein
MTYPITTQKEVRTLFWQEHPQFKRVPGRTQNDYPTDVRVAFVDFVDALCRDGQISEALAERVTL